MKLVITIAIIIIAGIFLFHKKSAPVYPRANSAAYRGLRDRVLRTSLKELNLTDDKLTSRHKIWGILMETGYEKYSFTLASLITGDTSLYLSSGGGIIGGGQHENVSRESIKMVSLADDYFNSAQRVSEYPLPNKNETIFYFLTASGIYKAEASKKDLGEKRHPLSPLFYAGMDVITQLRSLDEKR